MFKTMEDNIVEELKKFSDYIEHHLGHIVTRNADGGYELLDSFKNGKLLELYVRLRKNKIL